METLLTQSDSSWVAQAIINSLNSRHAPCVEQLRPRIFPDGNKWCCLYGENIQNGVAGFGDTPVAAVGDFENNFWNQKLNPSGTKY